MLRLPSLLFSAFIFISLGHAQQPSTNPAPAATNAPAVDASDQPPGDVVELLREAVEFLGQKKPDAAVDKVNEAILRDPKNVDAYEMRGSIFVAAKQWDKATADFQTALQLDGSDVQAKFNLGEIDFLQQKYELARSQFFALQRDKDLGDLATYKVFLCDLWGGHEDLAAKELNGMDRVDSGASFYFGKAAWFLYHKRTEDARTWLASAAGIYAPGKFKLYAASLFDLGYLPLPPPPQKS